MLSEKGSQIGGSGSAFIGRNHVSHQSLVPGMILSRQYHHLSHRSMSAEHRLDLSQFDADTAYFDLTIASTEKGESAVGAITNDISGSI
jgi:hypothetical protein